MAKTKKPSVKDNGGLCRVLVHLTGETALKMDRIPQETLELLHAGKKPPKTAEQMEPREAIEDKIYRLEDGRPHVPFGNLYACLVAAGVFIRLDAKRQVTNAKSTNLPGMLVIEDRELPLFLPGSNDSPSAEVDWVAGRNNSGNLLAVVRPRFDQWELRFHLQVDRNNLSLSLARDLVDIAGARIGLGPQRPQKKGMFGRFRVTVWDVLSEPLARLDQEAA